MSPLFGKRPEKKPLELPKLPSLPAFSEIPRLPVKEEMHEMLMFPEIPIQPSGQLIPSSISLIREEEPQSKEPIFIKINKYKEALTSFDILKKKVHETSEILDKICELRQQEDLQVEGWRKELENIKEKLNSIDSKLFLKL